MPDTETEGNPKYNRPKQTLRDGPHPEINIHQDNRPPLASSEHISDGPESLSKKHSDLEASQAGPQSRGLTMRPLASRAAQS